MGKNPQRAQNVHAAHPNLHPDRNLLCRPSIKGVFVGYRSDRPSFELEAIRHGHLHGD